ncbi:MAG: DUF11 domain-containing protein [Xanthomonadales bacterium]|nr:DUF11 domain-containing protein [Xanthomonadales bacterium]
MTSAPGAVESTVKPTSNRGGACGTVVLTQSLSQAITAANSVSCNSAAGHTDNSYFRAFDLSAFPGGFDVCAVEFGIETATNGGTGSQPVTVNVYAQSGGAFPGGTQTLVGTQAITMTDQAATIFNQPLMANLPAGTSELVFEVFTPNGQTNGDLFFIGSNAAGETGPSYLQAADCGVTAPTTTGAIGFGGMNIVMNVIGDSAGSALNAGPIATMDVCAAIPANNNNVIEPGEVVNFTIPLSASGGDYTNVVGTLTSGTAGVTIVSGLGMYGNITDGNTVNATYSIQVDEAVACFSSIDLNLAVTSTEDNFNFPFMRDVGQAAAFTYNGLPAAVTDNDPIGTSVTADVSGVAGPITDVDVQVNITHTWVGDVQIDLTSPGGTTVRLLDRPGVPASTFGCNNNDINVLFADGQADPEAVCDAAGSAAAWPVANAGPTTPLSAFNGEDANGTWTLTVIDNAGGDTGTIVDWELFIMPPAAATCSVCPSNADLTMTKTAAAPSPLVVGDTITYTLMAANAGPGDATGVVVTDALPANVTYVSNTCGATVAAGLVTWNIGALANGAGASCDVVVTVNAVGPISNTATATGDQTDPTPANNAGTADLGGATLADVVLLKSNNATGGLAPGDAFSFFINVTNNGPTDATNVVVTDVLSNKVSYVANTCGATVTGATLTWTIPTLANGAEANCEIQVIYVGLGDVINLVSSTANDPDPNPANNTDIESVATANAVPVPALNGFTLAALAALMAGLGLWMRRRFVKG